MKVLDLFSGIGGFSLGLERAGMETVAFCEIDPFCQKVLRKHWPDVLIYDDATGLTYDQLKADGITDIDVVCGGFPCQDLSVAGRQAGISGERSGLWSEIARLVSEIRPRYVIVENVTALISGGSGRWFGRVLGDLAQIGYDTEWHCIPASHVGAKHIRDRVWVVAYPQSKQRNGGNDNTRERTQPEAIPKPGNNRGLNGLAHTKFQRPQGRRSERRTEGSAGLCGGNGQNQEQELPTPTPKGAVKPGMGCALDGLSERLPRHMIAEALSQQHGIQLEWADGTWERGVPRVVIGCNDHTKKLKALGNSLVWQIPRAIGQVIKRLNDVRGSL